MKRFRQGAAGAFPEDGLIQQGGGVGDIGELGFRTGAGDDEWIEKILTHGDRWSEENGWNEKLLHARVKRPCDRNLREKPTDVSISSPRSLSLAAEAFQRLAFARGDRVRAGEFDLPGARSLRAAGGGLAIAETIEDEVVLIAVDDLRDEAGSV